MRNKILPSVINASTLVPKLTFLEREADEVEKRGRKTQNPVGAERLRVALNKHRVRLAKLGTPIPSTEAIDRWIAGYPISDSHIGFLHLFFQNRYEDEYKLLEPQQKKVFNQVRRFFRFYEEIITSDNSAKKSPKAKENVRSSLTPKRLLDVQIVLTGLIDHLDDVRTQVEKGLPNSPEAVAIKDKSLELIKFIDEKIDVARLDISRALDASQEDISPDQIALFEAIGGEFKRWIQENNPEIVDAVMRLTPAASFIGIMSLAGANMVWATPIVLALCGGKKIVEIVKGIKVG